MHEKDEIVVGIPVFTTKRAITLTEGNSTAEEQETPPTRIHAAIASLVVYLEN